MFVFKRGCIVVLVVFQLIFLDRTCHSQFHWGKNYEMEADNLRALLQRYASNQVPKTLENVPKVMFFFKEVDKFQDLVQTYYRPRSRGLANPP